MRHSKRVILAASASILLLGLFAGYRYSSAGSHCSKQGEIVCNAEVGRNPVGIGVDTALQRVFVVNRDSGSMSTIDAASGTVMHMTSIGGFALGPIVSERYHHVFVYRDIYVPFALRNSLQMLDAGSGAIMRQLALQAPPTALAVDEVTGRLFVATTAQTVVVFDASSGRAVRTLPVRGLVQSIVVDGCSGHTFCIMLPTVGRGIAPITPSPALLSMVDTVRLQIVRTVGLGRSPDASALASQDGRLFVANVNDNTVSMISTRDGIVQRTIRLQQPVNCGAIVLHGCAVGAGMAVDPSTHRLMIVTAHDATARILDTRSGALLQAITLGADPAHEWWSPVVIDTKNGNAYATGLPGTFVINVRNGHVLRRLAPHGSIMAIDQQLEHVFIARTDGASNFIGIVGLIRQRFSKDASNVYGSVTTLDAHL